MHARGLLEPAFRSASALDTSVNPSCGTRLGHEWDRAMEGSKVQCEAIRMLLAEPGIRVSHATAAAGHACKTVKLRALPRVPGSPSDAGDCSYHEILL